jgi:hypothetical protein
VIATGNSMMSQEFLAWQVGWDRGQVGVVRFWWLNLGLFIPSLVVALLWRGPSPLVERRLLRFYVPFALCFIVPNLLRLSPWIWDNLKFMIWWHLVSALLVALLLARLLRGGGGARATAAILFVLLTLSGSLDLWRTASGKIVLPIIPPEGMEFAQDIRGLTPPRALILHAPDYNSEVYLTGRRTLFGYPGHIWSQGLESGTRNQDVRRIYGFSPDARDLLTKYGVDFVVKGPRERAMAEFDERSLRGLELVAERGPYRLYRVR